jgi:beta-glucosidase
MATLLHWDTPIALRGAWLNRDTASRFGDYAYQVGEYFRDRIDSWVTLNDPAAVTLSGYALGNHAPGETLLFDALPAAHHQLLGHGLAVQALRAASVTGQVGIALAWSPVEPAVNRDDDRAAAALFSVLHNQLYADAVLLGRYPEPPEEFRTELRLLLETDSEDLATIHQPLDFLGLNYLAPSRVAAGILPALRPPAGPPPGRSGIQTDAPPQFPFHFLPFREFPVTGSGQPVAPESLVAALTELRERYQDRLPPVVVTASGASWADVVDERGDVHDPLRIDYLAEHLIAATEAVAAGGAAEGVDLRGFYIWTLLDAFEWTAGYTQPQGLVHVNFANDTRVRTPKTSYRWLQDVLEHR